MKMQNKKRGFTIVELVIVIAVIAILSSVLVPTFSGIIKKAKKSAAEQEASNLARAVAGTTEYGRIPDAGDIDAYIITNNYWFTVNEGEISDPQEGDLPDTVKVDFDEKADLDTLTTAGTYYVPVKLLDDFDLAEEEEDSKVYAAYVVE